MLGNGIPFPQWDAPLSHNLLIRCSKISRRGDGSDADDELRRGGRGHRRATAWGMDGGGSCEVMAAAPATSSGVKDAAAG